MGHLILVLNESPLFINFSNYSGEIFSLDFFQKLKVKSFSLKGMCSGEFSKEFSTI